MDNTPFENVNNKFCKNIMSLPTQASNFGVKAELGRKPLFSFICSQTLRYWVRLANMNSNRILKKAYFSEMVIHRDGGNSWCTFLLKLLDVTGQNQLWRKQSDIHMNTCELSKLKQLFSDKIAELYFMTQFKKVGHGSKLRTYTKFKNDYKLENYVNISDVPLMWRKLFCAFRISCHELEIERGRYIRPRKPPEERICHLCLQDVETESHFMIYCNAYTHIRNKFFQDVIKLDNQFVNVENHKKFEYLMTTDNVTVVKKVMEFLYLATKLRKKKLSDK